MYDRSIRPFRRKIKSFFSLKKRKPRLYFPGILPIYGRNRRRPAPTPVSLGHTLMDVRERYAFLLPRKKLPTISMTTKTMR